MMLCRSVDAGVRAEFDLPPVRKEWTVEKKLKNWDATQAKCALSFPPSPHGPTLPPHVEGHMLSIYKIWPVWSNL